MLRISRDVDQPPAVGAAVQVVHRVGVVLLLHQHRQRPAHVGLVLLQGDPVLQVQQPLEPGLFLGHGGRVLHLGGGGPHPGGEDKGKQGVEPHLLQQGEGLLEFRLGLPGEAHNHVAGEHHVGNQLPEPPHLIQIGLPVVVAVHGLQHPAGAGLERQVELGRHLGAAGHGLKEFLRGVPGVAGHKAHKEVPGNGVNPGQQVGKVDLQPQILAVAVHVLAQEGDVLIPLRHQLAHLVHDALRVPGALPAPDVGHDAVGTEVVAAVHDGHPGLDLPLADHRQALGDAAVGVFGGEHPLPFPQHLVQQLRELPQGVGAEDQVHVAEGAADFVRHMGLLHGAAAQADHLLRLPPLGVGEGPHVAQHPQLRVLPDGAGVDDDHIRLSGILGEAVAHLPEHPPDLLAVRLILLAAVGVHQGQGLDGPLPVPPGHLAAELHLPGNFFLGDQHFLPFSHRVPPHGAGILGEIRHFYCLPVYHPPPANTRKSSPFSRSASCQKCQNKL